MNRTGLQAYGTQQVMTSSPATLVAMLYDKAITSLRDAMQAIEQGQIERRWQSNRKAFEIINHLSMTLDMERGGEVAANLERLYDFALRRMLDIDLKNDAQAAQEVIDLLDPLRRSWHELAKTGGQPAAAPATGVPAAGAYRAAAAPPQPTPAASKPFKLSA